MTVKFINLKNFDKLAVISGEGKLPHLLFKEMNKIKVKTWAFHPQNISVKTPKKMTKIVFNLLDIEGLFFDLKKKKIKNVVFAGKITRNITNNLNPEVKNNIFTNEVHPFLKQTDDKLLRKIGKIFENHGFIINGVNELLPDSLASEGTITNKKPSLNDNADIIKAKQYHNLFSKADIGQSLVVSSGLCVAIETLPGTDEMLDFVKRFKFKNYPRTNMKNGILYKGVKVDQDKRFDFPVIGMDTIKKAKGANLCGIVLQKNNVILLDKKKIIKSANDLGLFIVVV